MKTISFSAINHYTSRAELFNEYDRLNKEGKPVAHVFLLSPPYEMIKSDNFLATEEHAEKIIADELNINQFVKSNESAMWLDKNCTKPSLIQDWMNSGFGRSISEYVKSTSKACKNMLTDTKKQFIVCINHIGMSERGLTSYMVKH